MTILHSIVLGIVEGFTEFLPISSTAHLILISKLLHLEETPLVQTFQISIQIGAILAVCVLFYKKFFNIKLLIKLAAAFIPTGIAGLLLYPHLKSFFANDWLIIFTLFTGGIIILIVEKWFARTFSSTPHLLKDSVSLKDAIILGCVQAIAIVPGVSRSGSTIIGGLLLGIKRSVITEFTFLLAVPTMFVATAYTIYKSREILTLEGSMIPILIGTATSFIVALFVIKKFLSYIRKQSFEIFGWYRIVLALIVASILFI